MQSEEGFKDHTKTATFIDAFADDCFLEEMGVKSTTEIAACDSVVPSAGMYGTPVFLFFRREYNSNDAAMSPDHRSYQMQKL